MNTTDVLLPADKLRYWAEHAGDDKVLFQPVKGELVPYTWNDLYNQAQAVAAALRNMGFVQGDKVAILSKNCVEWFIADFALILGGYISVPIYPTANAETIDYVLKHAECKAIFIGKLDDFVSQDKGIGSEYVRIGMSYPDIKVDHPWEECLATAPTELGTEVTADDVMTILYTSGSTGHPKGAVHSYRNFVNSGYHSGKRLLLSTKDRCLSYLPLAHCTERAYIESTLLTFGQRLYFVESLDTFARDLQVCSPTMFGSVPRLWTLFQKGVLENLPQKKLDLLLKIPLVSGFIKNTIKKKLGLSDARIYLSGSAPLSEKILEWYKKIDIEIGEGWGMTETMAAGSSPRLDMPIKMGTISHPAEGTHMKIAEDGEILIKSDSTMLCYYKDEEKTAETLIDGYVHTGDLGEIDQDGYVTITGRKKDIFKTEKGKYVAPVPIEKLFAENQFIEQMCLMGTTLVQPVLVVNLSQHARTHSDDNVSESLGETLKDVNQSLEKHERVSHIIISKSEWTPESGELTPTLKVKRHVIEKLFIERAQQGSEQHIDWH